MTLTEAHTNGATALPVPKKGRIGMLEDQVCELRTQMAAMQKLVATMMAQTMLANPAVHEKLANDLIAGMNGSAKPQP